MMAAIASINTGPRRSATVPTTLQRPSGDASAVDPSAETLFAHPAVKIVCFTAPNIRPGSSAGAIGSPKDVGTLPWKRSNERVVAVGPLRIYRVPGSVSFIASGDLLLSLLPRSQCWCVDGESKFAMFIKGMTYRIELPFETEEDKVLVEEMKEALGKVLKYEKTPCPFSRGFDVDGVDEPNSPIPLGPKWSHIKDRKRESADAAYLDPNEGNTKAIADGSSPDISDEDGSMSTVTEDTFIPRQTNLEDNQQDTTKPPIRPRVADTIRAFSNPLAPVVTGVSPSQPLTKDNVERQRLQPQEQSADLSPSLIQRTPMSQASLDSQSPISPQAQISQLDNERRRPYTVPDTLSDDPFVDHEPPAPFPPHSVKNTPSNLSSISASDQNNPPMGKVDFDESTFTEVHSETDLPTVAIADTSAATNHPGVSTMSQTTVDDTQMQRNIADTTAPPDLNQITPDPEPSLSDIEPIAPAPELASIANEAPTQLHRQPSSESLSTSPHAQPHRASSSLTTPMSPPAREFSAGIISRTAAILMGPPSGLIQIMMQIASRIARGADAAGAYRFRLGPGTPSGKRVHLGRRYSNLPGRWQDSEDDGEESASSVTGSEARSLEEDEWSENYSDEDDYGVSLRNDEAGKARRRKWSASEQGEWEID